MCSHVLRVAWVSCREAGYPDASEVFKLNERQMLGDHLGRHVRELPLLLAR